jgi:arginine decarboxylase
MLAVNRWNETYERVLLVDWLATAMIIILSKTWMLSICRNTKRNHCTSGFNTGAYQETIGGYGGLHHCLIPQPKHI